MFRACALFSLGLRLLTFQIVQQGVEALETVFPKTPVSLDPDLELLKRRGTQRIDPALSVYANVNQPGITEHSQMFGNLRLAEMQPMDHVPDGAWAVPQEFDDLEAVGLGQGSEGRYHGWLEYALYRIFVSRNILIKEYTGFPSHRELPLG